MRCYGIFQRESWKISKLPLWNFITMISYEKVYCSQLFSHCIFLSCSYLQSRKFPVAWNLNNNNNNNFLVKLEIFIESFRSYWRVVQVFEIIQHHRHVKIFKYVYVQESFTEVLCKKLFIQRMKLEAEAWITTNFNVSNLVPLHVNVPNCNTNVDFISHYY